MVRVDNAELHQLLQKAGGFCRQQCCGTTMSRCGCSSAPDSVAAAMFVGKAHSSCGRDLMLPKYLGTSESLHCSKRQAISASMTPGRLVRCRLWRPETTLPQPPAVPCASSSPGIWTASGSRSVVSGTSAAVAPDVGSLLTGTTPWTGASEERKLHSNQIPP